MWDWYHLFNLYHKLHVSSLSISILWRILMTFWNDCSPHPCLRTKLIFPKLKLEESFCLGNQRSQGNRCLIISIHEFRIPPCWSISKTPSSPNRTPWKINMEPQITHVERNMIWTKPPWLCSMWIFRGEFHLLFAGSPVVFPRNSSMQSLRLLDEGAARGANLGWN